MIAVTPACLIVAGSVSLALGTTRRFDTFFKPVGLALIGLVYAYLKLTPVPVMASFPGTDDGVVIDGAVPVTDEILRRILLASLGALALLTALAGVVGWFVAGLVITPLRSIADDARTVTRGDLSARIDYDGPRDEVGELAEALNAMLDELADAVERQRRFAANASHELKTPIATIQTVADVALSGEDTNLRPAVAQIRVRGHAAVVDQVRLGRLDRGQHLTTLLGRRDLVVLRVQAQHLRGGAGIELRGGPLGQGVIDPVKVTRSALQNAGSIAGLFLTTEAVVADKPEPAAAAGGGEDPMGGMGGMM